MSKGSDMTDEFVPTQLILLFLKADFSVLSIQAFSKCGKIFQMTTTAGEMQIIAVELL